MDAASYAAQSDPDCNRHFRRRWTEPEMPPPRDARERVKTLEEIATDLALDWRRHLQKRAT